MAEVGKHEETSEAKPPKFVLKIDPKKDPKGNDIKSNNGPMETGDSTWKKRLEMMADED